MKSLGKHGRTKVGRIEQAGVDYLPEEARDSRPLDIVFVYLGSPMGWTSAVYGWIAVGLGLDFWGAVSAMLIGVAVGAAIDMPLTLMGPRTGTNMTVASGAHLGIRGRFIGSGIGLISTLMFAALTVWTSGDAIVAAAHRLLGTPDGKVALAVAYGLVSILMVLAALYGNATIIAAQKVVVPISATVIVLGFFAYSDTFTAAQPAGTEYALGGFWQTWVLMCVLSLSTSISYAPTVGDYTRRLSRRHSDLAVSGSIAGAITVGLVVPMTLGAFISMSFTNPSGSFLGDLVAAAPTWYLVPILAVSVFGGLGSGVLCVYASGLDLESFFPRLRRVHTTALAAALALLLLYVGAFVYDAEQSITDGTVVVNALAVPWVSILFIGALRRRRKGYDVHDLQAFAQRRHGGRYWFTHGWNVPAVLAWLAGSVWGVLAVGTETFRGPLADVAGGVDMSAIGSGVIAAGVYLAVLAIRPGAVDAPEAPDAPEVPAVDTPDAGAPALEAH